MLNEKTGDMKNMEQRKGYKNNTANIVSNNSVIEAYARTKKRYKKTLIELAK